MISARDSKEDLGLEMETLKRLKKKPKAVVEKKEKKIRRYMEVSNNMFYKYVESLSKKDMFSTLNRDLLKANMQIIPKTYISMILFTTFLSIIAAIFIFMFFMFFNFGAKLPIITMVKGGYGIRFIKVFWILVVIPAATFFVMYIYPSLEKKNTETKINQELPFATIHMASISGSMIDPSKIFSIIVSTREYPYVGKEFVKLMNEINVLGHDLITALRHSAFNSPSDKLAELFNGLATTITSGGDLPMFFDKRAQSLLFEYRIEKEKYTKTAETFMDIYISIVIAAPMILMLLLMMMKISGFGIAIGTSTITFLMVTGVAIVNLVFLTFLHLKQT